MSLPKVTFHTYPGLGQTNSNLYHYSQAVRIGPTVRTSGQGGFLDSGEIVTGPRDQIRTAFLNVERALKDAGIKHGWKQVVAVRSYHLDLEESFEIVVDLFKEFMGSDRRPVWVAVAVKGLGEGMIVEIEVEANDGVLVDNGDDDEKREKGVNGE